MFINKQISTVLAVSIIIFLSAAVGIFSWAASRSVGAICDVSYDYGSKIKSRKQACTQEAKVCPNGSSVGRTGLNCEFTPCPDEIVGNDKDEHGCIGSAGYQWCEEKQKCLRIWEEDCTLQNIIIYQMPEEAMQALINALKEADREKAISLIYEDSDSQRDDNIRKRIMNYTDDQLRMHGSTLEKGVISKNYQTYAEWQVTMSYQGKVIKPSVDLIKQDGGWRIKSL